MTTLMPRPIARFAGRALLTILIASSIACARLPEPSRWPLPPRVEMPDLHWVNKGSALADVCVSLSDAASVLGYINTLQGELEKARLTIGRANERR